MKPIKLISLIFIFPLFFSCGQKKDQFPTDIVNIPASADKGIDKDDLPDIKFDEDIFDFGTITQGEKVSHDFKFKNTGKKNLIIANAYADCGCTVPEVPKNPVSPGDGNSIRVSFDSNRISGIITKQITILTNCIPNKHVLKIKANIFVPTSNKSVKP